MKEKVVSNDHYNKNELLNITDDIKILIKTTYNHIKDDYILSFMSEYLYYSKHKSQYYFNFKRRKGTVNIKQLKNTDDIFMIQNVKQDKIISLTDTPEELRLLEQEFLISMSTPKLKPYKLPKENSFEKKSLNDPLYDPRGSQWVHEIQKDDDINNQINRRAIQFDKLRNIILPEQRSPEWFSMRRGKITASDGACALGLNKYEPQYKFILKKIYEYPFITNKHCYHGKKLEEIATMIYAYRMNVCIDEFGLLGHHEHNFLGASPDGICNRYKFDGIHKSKLVGRMLEIKCPAIRKIKMSGPIKDHICPIYYWIQVQLQLECCDLDECDFWQCKIEEYKNRNEFNKDTDPKYPHTSLEHKQEKGCLIQLLPRNRYKEIDQEYWQTVYNYAQFIYPDKIEMSPYDCDNWILKTMNQHNINCARHRVCKAKKDDSYTYEFSDYYIDKVIYWKLIESKNVIIKRDTEWFNDNLGTFKKIWGYVEYYRKHKDKMDLINRYIQSLYIKSNKDIMNIIEKLTKDNEDDIIKLKKLIEKNEVEKKAKLKYKETKSKANKISFDNFLFVNDKNDTVASNNQEDEIDFDNFMFVDE